MIAQNNEQESNSHSNADAEQDDETTVLVNSTAAKNINPGDIRKLMSTTNKPNNSPPSKKTVFKSEIVIDGETHRKDGESYRKVNVCVTYQLSKTNRSSPYSLVDRGANGGVAGNDVRVI